MSEGVAAPRIAALPMYHSAPPQVESFWRVVAKHLLDAGEPAVPAALAWPSDVHAHWLSPDLLLSQACGYPLVTFLAGKVRVVGAFHYAAPGCRGVDNRSQLVVRADTPAAHLAEMRGKIVAYNSTDSQSGYNSLRAMVAPLATAGAFFGGRVATGSHLQSVLAVRNGQADIAAIDCVSLAGFARHMPDTTRGLRVLDQSAPYPGLPLVTAGTTSDDTLARLRAALALAAQDDALQQVRADLFIQRFEALDASAYQVCADMRDAAYTQGCAAL